MVDVLLKQMHQENAVNVFSVIAKLRSQRNFIVQTEDQYAFIYETLLEASLSGNTELPARQLRSHWYKLVQPCPSTASESTAAPGTDGVLTNTGLALEFGQLVSQTISPLAAAVAHRTPGGLLACVDNLETTLARDQPEGLLPVRHYK